MKKKLLPLVYLGLLGIVGSTLLDMHAEEILEPEIANDSEIQALQKNVSKAQDAYQTQIAHMQKSIAENKNANIVNTFKNWFAKTDTNEPIAENTEKQLQEITNTFANKLVEADEKLKNAIKEKRASLTINRVAKGFTERRNMGGKYKETKEILAQEPAAFAEALQPKPEPKLTAIQLLEKKEAEQKAVEKITARAQIESQENGLRTDITDQETTEFNQQLKALEQQINGLKLNEEAIAAQKKLSADNQSAIEEDLKAAKDTEAKIAILKQTRLFPKESSWMDRLKQWLDGFITRLQERFSRNR